MNALDNFIDRIEAAKDFARVTYEANKQNGSAGTTLEFDAGRYDAFKEVLEIVKAMK